MIRLVLKRGPSRTARDNIDSTPADVAAGMYGFPAELAELLKP